MNAHDKNAKINLPQKADSSILKKSSLSLFQRNVTPRLLA